MRRDVVSRGSRTSGCARRCEGVREGGSRMRGFMLHARVVVRAVVPQAVGARSARFARSGHEEREAVRPRASARSGRACRRDRVLVRWFWATGRTMERRVPLGFCARLGEIDRSASYYRCLTGLFLSGHPCGEAGVVLQGIPRVCVSF